MKTVPDSTPHSTAQKYLEFIDSFKRGNYLDVIADAFRMPPSLLVFHYISLSCKRVNAPIELIEYINYFISQPHHPTSKQKKSRIDFSTINIPTVDQLINAQPQHSDSQKAKLIAIENYIFNNTQLFAHCDKLSCDQIRALSNLINILGDTYRYYWKLRAAFETLKLANQIFPNSFYSRVNYADWAYKLNKTTICLENLRHANHLLYHSETSKGEYIHAPHNNTISPTNALSIKNFFSLSCRCGFLPG